MDARTFPHHPFPVGGVQKDFRIETLRPIDHRSVIMRMRNGDGADAAARVYFCDGFIVKECDAIPEQISAGRSPEQCALTDGKFRFGADPAKWRRSVSQSVMSMSS